MTAASAPGVKINLVSRTFFDPLPSSEKIRFILDEVEAGKVLVLERGLSATEEAQLISATMAKIDPDGFIGIEMQSYGQDPEGRWRRLLSQGRRGRPRMVVIGPANMLQSVRKDARSLQAVLVSPDGPAPGA